MWGSRGTAAFDDRSVRPMLWRGYLLIGVGVLVAYQLASRDVRNVLYVAVAASCLAAIIVGVVRHRPRQRTAWVLLMLGLALWTVGDVITVYLSTTGNDSYPSIADVAYLLGYPMLGGAVIGFIGRRSGGRPDPGGLLDSGILTAGLALLGWVVLSRPVAHAAGESIGAAAVGAAYPVLDVLLTGLLIRLVTTPGGRLTSIRLLLCGGGLLVLGDGLFAANQAWLTVDSGLLDTAWLASYLLWGAAALHPSMRQLTEPDLADPAPFTRRRLLALTLAALAAPATLLVERLIGATVDVWAISIASIVLFLLVVTRMNLSIRQIVTANAERVRLQDHLAHQAAHDSLTDLPNRTMAMEGIESALARAQTSGALFALLFIDLDGFKAVNDTLGHRSGDQVLRVVAGRLRDAVRPGDMVARLAGDEFVVLMENLDNEYVAVDLAGRVVEIMRQPIVLGDGRVARIGASIGLALSQDGSIDAERLLHDADVAVYRAKAGGKGRVEVFGDQLRAELEERATLESDLRRAIDSGELLLHYQPIFELTTGKVIGYEALVRWDRPGHGLMMPSDFIPTAELSDLVCDLDAWVLREATCQLRRWGRTDRQVAVNISGRYVSAPRVMDDVRAALAVSGLPARLLVLEITETVVVEDVYAAYHLAELRAAGVLVTLDDFGAGYNSLPRLRQLPLDAIKIDRFYLDLRQSSSRALLELMIKAAHAFGIPVLVEGVETPDQLAALKELGCEFGQGYYLSMPLTVEQVEQLAEPVH